MKFCLTAAILGFAGAVDVTLDTDKLTDFTSEFDASVTDLPYGPRMAILMNGEMRGKVQVNLLAEKLKFSYEGNDNWHMNADSPQRPPHAPFGMLIPGAVVGSGEIVIDGPAGQATITQKSSGYTQEGIEMDMNYCFHVKLPAGFVPPGGMLKQRADQMFPRIEQELNQLPHTEIENGDLVYTIPTRRGRYYAEEHYPTRDLSFTIKSDGSPVAWHLKSTCDAACMERGWAYANPGVSLIVNSFTAGAGDVTPVPCVDSSVADLSEHPGVMHAAAVFDAFMEQFATSSGLSLPSLQPLIEQQMVLAENANNPGAQQQSWMVVVLAGVAGMAGGAVVLALDRASQGRAHDHPLLSEA